MDNEDRPDSLFTWITVIMAISANSDMPGNWMFVFPVIIIRMINIDLVKQLQ